MKTKPLWVFIGVCSFIFVEMSFSKEGSVWPNGLCPLEPVEMNSKNGNDYQKPSICENMAPGFGVYPPEKKPVPWIIFTYSDKIRQNHIQPVTIGSADDFLTFNGYMITAKAFKNEQLGEIIGSFAYQWDTTPVCCEQPSIADPSSDIEKQKKVLENYFENSPGC